MSAALFTSDVLTLDTDRTVREISAAIRRHVFNNLRRKGAVIGLSGGIDSSVVSALSADALGQDRTFALLMPERESSDDSLALGQLVADKLQIRTVVEDITPILEAAGCYRRRDEMIRALIPEYGPGWKSKIVLPGKQEHDGYNIFSVIAESPDGKQMRARLTPEAYYGIVAATNFKQRVRKMMEYHYADRLNYAVLGTPNRLEYDQGFFVKNGDGAADLKPIAHLYKTQVYQLAKNLSIPEEVQLRTPTTDTYSMNQTQEEFYFALPYRQMDLCLYGRNNSVPVEEVARAAGMTPEQVQRVYDDIASKRRATRYQHASHLLVEPVAEIDHQ